MSKQVIWVPHTLTEKNSECRIFIATSLLSGPKNDPFLKNVITVDKKMMILFNAKSSPFTKMNLSSLLQRESFMKKKLYYMYGGILAVLFILSF